MASRSSPIDVVSDVVCPWCFIGKRRLEKAIALRPEIPVAVRFASLFPQSLDCRARASAARSISITKFGSRRALHRHRRAGRRGRRRPKG